jgi:hypothetical protein
MEFLDSVTMYNVVTLILSIGVDKNDNVWHRGDEKLWMQDVTLKM